MQKIKSGDEVIVIAGKDKGKRGNVDRVLADGRVIVSGVNIIKKHTKPSQNPDGSINEGWNHRERSSFRRFKYCDLQPFNG